MNGTGEQEEIVWLSCFLAADDPIYSSFSALGERLRRSARRLVVFGPGGDYGKHDGFDHVVVPFSLEQQGLDWSNLLEGTQIPFTATVTQELLACDRHWNGRPATLGSEYNVLRALSFWESALRVMRPSVIIAWGTTIPFSQLLMRIASASRTPCYVAERGLFENTLMLNLVGQTALSNIGLRTAFMLPGSDADTVTREWDRITRYYHVGSEVNYANHNKPSEVVGLSATQGPVVLYLGAFDRGSGLFPSKEGASNGSDAFISSQQGLDCLIQASAANLLTATIVYKSHPANKISPTNKPAGVRLVCADDVNFKFLLSQCDVMVTPGSTTQVYGFILDKPVIVLANSFFTGRDIVYEARNTASLEDALARALRREGWDDKLANAKHLIVALFQNDFIGLTKGTPCRLQMRDLAEHLARFIAPAGGTSPAAGRIEDFHLLRMLASGLKREWSPDQVRRVLGDAVWAQVTHSRDLSLSENSRAEMMERLEIAERDLQEVRTAALLEKERISEERDVARRELVDLQTTHASALAAALDREQAFIRALEHMRAEASESRSAAATATEAMAALKLQADAKLHAIATAHQSELAHLREAQAEERKRTIEHLDSLRMRAEHAERIIASKLEEILSLRAHVDALLARNESHTADLALASDWISKFLTTIRAQPQRPKSWRSQKTASERAVLPLVPLSYLLANPDVAQAGVDPIDHWERHGREEGRPISRAENTTPPR